MRQTEIFVILGNFFPFSPLTTWKIKILTLKHLEILSFYTFDIIFCHSGPFFPFYPPMDPENQNFEKVKKAPEDIIILKMCAIDDCHMMYGS